MRHLRESADGDSNCSPADIATPTLRGVAETIAEPSRLRLLQALMAPATVSELVARTGFRQANISNHLARLRAHGLVNRKRSGRLVEYRLANESVARLVESVSVLAGPAPAAERAILGEARTCYDHLAGRLGVALFDGLIAANAIRDDPQAHGAIRFGRQASRILGSLGVDIQTIVPGRRRLAYRCLDWTERRDHIGGTLGAVLASAFLAHGLVRRRRGDRALEVAPRAWLRIDSLGTQSR